MKKQLLLSFFALFFGTFLTLAQTTPVCGGTFTDPAGATTNYANNSNVTTTICPSNPGEFVSVSFSSFALENNFDRLKIYNGTSASAPLIANLTGSTIPTTYTSSDSSGCLTFVFTSDSSVNQAGWVANITCGLPSSCLVPTNLLTTDITSNSVVLSWSESGSATSWEVIAMPCGTAPSPSSTGTIVTSNPYVLTGLNPGTCYNLFVRSICSATETSFWSMQKTITTLAALSTCPTPNPIFSSNFTPNSLDLGWTENGSSTSWEYLVLPCTATTPTASTTGTLTSTNPTTISGLNPNTCYKLFVRAVCSATEKSAWSTVLSATTLPLTVANPVCGETFTDNGGLTANYANGSDNTYVICPTVAGEMVNVIFNSFDTEANWDGLYVYNGNSITSPQISSTNPAGSVPGGLPGAFWGTSIPEVITSSSPDGCLTFRFRSDTAVNKPGWNASVVCGTVSICLKPTNIVITPNSINSATIAWTENNAATQWEVIVQPSSMAAPTSTSTGVLTSSNPYLANGLLAGTSYKVYVRSFCSGTSTSNWAASSSFFTPTCSAPSGYLTSIVNPTSVNITWSSGVSTQWEVLILPATAPIPTATSTGTIITTNSYIATDLSCFTSYKAYVRTFCSSTTSSSWSSTTFSTANPIVIENLVGCDDNGDGSVIFNLTTSLTTTNPVSFYTSLVDATNQTNAITNPTIYSLLTTSPAVTIFARETIVSSCDMLYRFQLNAYSDCNLAYECINANSLCSSLGTPFANTHQSISAEIGNNYGCLASTPNPTWFYLPISSAGTVNLTIQQSSNITFVGGQLDVDYVIYGPFTSPTAPCSSGLTTSNIVSCSFSGAAIEYPIIPNALPGQYYLLMTTNFSNQPGFINITMNSTSTGDIDCSGFRLNAFLDTNSNGTQEVGEQNFPLGQFHYEINDDGNVHNITSPVGRHSIYDINPLNSYDLSYSINPAYTSMYSITTSAYNNVNVVVGGGMITYNFPITITNNYNDLSVAIIPSNAPRAGFLYQNKIVYTNLGNQTIASGNLNFNHDTAVTIATISQTGTTTIPNGFTYNFTNLLPFETREITVVMNVPSLPTVSIGQLLVNTASISSTVTEISLANNNSTLTQEVIAAYDPNDKMEAHGEQILFSSFSPNDYLTYTIRFENTGNATALDVRVNDLLDSKLDETSLTMLSASHPYILDRVENNLSWNFNNIQLPPSVENTDIGKGYITFKIKLKPGFAVGDIVPNTANIFFDTNPAIVTNTFNTEFVA
ncbi:fibronectin type III domain-containing protein, partial [Flavobacterium sp.]|uniref:DUF7619 domain-containing protein n=1 Tax=Flavobacterium sp. TaxID=239 RepID=UPI00260B1F75